VTRLSGPESYRAVFDFKCRVASELFYVYARPNHTDEARLGIVVSKRLIALAVRRNYCKRLTREVFRAEEKVLVGVDLIVRPRTVIARSSSKRAREEVKSLLHRARKRALITAELSKPPGASSVAN